MYLKTYKITAQDKKKLGKSLLQITFGICAWISIVWHDTVQEKYEMAYSVIAFIEEVGFQGLWNRLSCWVVCTVKHMMYYAAGMDIIHW